MLVWCLHMQYVPLLCGQCWSVLLHRGRRAMLHYVPGSTSSSLRALTILVEIAQPCAAPASAAAPTSTSAQAAATAAATAAASSAVSAAACVAAKFARRRAAHATLPSTISSVAAGHTVTVVTA